MCLGYRSILDFHRKEKLSTPLQNSAKDFPIFLDFPEVFLCDICLLPEKIMAFLLKWKAGAYIGLVNRSVLLKHWILLHQNTWNFERMNLFISLLKESQKKRITFSSRTGSKCSKYRHLLFLKSTSQWLLLYENILEKRNIRKLRILQNTCEGVLFRKVVGIWLQLY